MQDKDPAVLIAAIADAEHGCNLAFIQEAGKVDRISGDLDGEYKACCGVYVYHHGCVHGKNGWDGRKSGRHQTPP